MKTLQDLLARKKRKEELKREQKQKHVLHEIKDIFLENFDVENLNEKAPIVPQLVQIIEKINGPNVDANENLMQWLETKFEKGVMEKLATQIYIK